MKHPPSGARLDVGTLGVLFFKVGQDMLLPCWHHEKKTDAGVVGGAGVRCGRPGRRSVDEGTEAIVELAA